MMILLTVLFSTFCHADVLMNILEVTKQMDGIALDCDSTISKDGIYINENGILVESNKECQIRILVPPETVATVTINQETCQKISSQISDIAIICNLTDRELDLGEDTTFYYKFSESISISVKYTQLIKTYCGRNLKNMHSLFNKTIVLENNSKRRCSLGLPAAIEIKFINLSTKSRRKCCADLLTASVNSIGYGIEYRNFSTCDLGKKSISATTRCKKSWLYLRNAAFEDQLTFRVEPLDSDFMNDCEIKDTFPPDYTCIPRTYKKQGLIS